MPPNPWSPNSQYLSTVLNDPSAPTTGTTPHTSSSTPPRPRQSSAQLHQVHAQQGPFTAAQRSAQARGKAFNGPGSTIASGSNSGAQTRQASTSATAETEAESYAVRERRNEAAAILDSTELLLWYSAARNESVAQTRRYYRGVVLGVGEGERVWKEEWEVEGLVGKGRGVGKGKKRGVGCGEGEG